MRQMLGALEVRMIMSIGVRLMRKRHKVANKIVVWIEILMMDVVPHRDFSPLVHPYLSMKIGLAAISTAFVIPTVAKLLSLWVSRVSNPSIHNRLSNLCCS